MSDSMPVDEQALARASWDFVDTFSLFKHPEQRSVEPASKSNKHKLLAKATGFVALARESSRSIATTNNGNPEYYLLAVDRHIPPEPAGDYGHRAARVKLWFNGKAPDETRYDAWYNLYIQGDGLQVLKTEHSFLVTPPQGAAMGSDFESDVSVGDADVTGLLNLIELYETYAKQA